jgi:hypothetical protein
MVFIIRRLFSLAPGAQRFGSDYARSGMKTRPLTPDH